MKAFARAVHLRLVVSPDRHAELFEFLIDAKPYYEAIPGAHVRLLQDAADPCRFLEVVEYDTEEAYAADAERVASDLIMLGFLDRWRAVLDEPPQVETFHDITDRILSDRPTKDRP